MYNTSPWEGNLDHENELDKTVVISNIPLKIHDNGDSEWKWPEQLLLHSLWCHWSGHWKTGPQPSWSSRCDDIGGQAGSHILQHMQVLTLNNSPIQAVFLKVKVVVSRVSLLKIPVSHQEDSTHKKPSILYHLWGAAGPQNKETKSETLNQKHTLDTEGIPSRLPMYHWRPFHQATWSSWLHSSKSYQTNMTDKIFFLNFFDVATVATIHKRKDTKFGYRSERTVDSF